MVLSIGIFRRRLQASACCLLNQGGKFPQISLDDLHILRVSQSCSRMIGGHEALFIFEQNRATHLPDGYLLSKEETQRSIAEET